MFEQEAEESFVKSYPEFCCNRKPLSPYWDLWQDGAEFGYNKAMEEMQEKGLALQSDMDRTIEQNLKLKKRNGELAGQKASLERWFGEAKKIIGNLYAICKDNHYLDGSVIMEQAESFLKGGRVMTKEEQNIHAMAEQYEATYSHASITEAWLDGYNFVADKYVSKLAKAIWIIRDLLSCLYSVEYDSLSDLEEAEQFLKKYTDDR